MNNIVLILLTVLLCGSCQNASREPWALTPSRACSIHRALMTAPTLSTLVTWGCRTTPTTAGTCAPRRQSVRATPSTPTRTPATYGKENASDGATSGSSERQRNTPSVVTARHVAVSVAYMLPPLKYRSVFRICPLKYRSVFRMRPHEVGHCFVYAPMK